MTATLRDRRDLQKNVNCTCDVDFWSKVMSLHTTHLLDNKQTCSFIVTKILSASLHPRSDLKIHGQTHMHTLKGGFHYAAIPVA